MIRLSFKPLSLGLLTLGCMAAASTASAGTITTWSGTSPINSNWSTGTNWSTPLNTSGTFSLVFSGNLRTTSTNNLGPDAVKVDSILFANTGTTNPTSNFTLRQSSTTPALSLLNGATVTTTAATSGTLSDSIPHNLAFGGTATFNMGSRHNLLLSGTLSGGGSIVKQGAGDLSLTGTNDLAALKIDQGLVHVSNLAIAGITDLTVDIGSSGETGTLRVAGVGSGTTPVQTNMKFNLNGDANITTSNVGIITFNAANFNEAVASVTTPVTLSLIGGAVGFNGTQTINGVIQDNSASGKVNVTIGTATSENIWVLNGINTYTGSTTIQSNGKLLMNGSVAAGSTTTSYGYLGGSGTFGGAVIVSSGTLAPGGSSLGGVIVDTVGDLTMASLSLGSTATTQLSITGTAANLYDQIVAVGSGELTYGGNLALTLTGSQAYALNTTFNLFENFVTRSGSFSSVTLLATDTPYDGLVFANVGGGIWETGSTGDPLNEYLRFEQSTGNLVAVPEPSTYAMALAGLAYGGWQIFRRRRLRQAPALAA
jgi:autotransporter-associated beta strand protein